MLLGGKSREESAAYAEAVLARDVELTADAAEVSGS